MSLLSESVTTILEAEQVIAQTVVYGSLNNVSDVYTSHAVYDYAVQGGSTANPIVLPLSSTIPEGAIVYGVLFDITTAIQAGANATLQFIINGQSFISLVTASPWNVGANPVQLDEAWKLSDNTSSVSLKFAVADGSQGAMNIAVLYIL